MIVVVGQPLYRESGTVPLVDGLAARIALAAASRQHRVQLVGKTGEDAAGDAVVLALAQGGVGHVALLRDAGRPTRRLREPIDDLLDAPGDAPEAEVGVKVPSNWPVLEAGDIDLALRYLTEFAVLVLADPADAETVRTVSDAAGWAEARLIVVVGPGASVPEGLPADVIVFESPDGDPDGVFASLVGSFAAALDDGSDPAEAFKSSIESDGWTASTDS